MQKHLKAKQTINFITMVFNSNSPNTLLFTEYVGKTVAMSVFPVQQWLYMYIYIGFFFSQISSITKTHVFLPLKEKVGSGAGKKGFFSANSAPAPNAAQSIHNVLVCLCAVSGTAFRTCLPWAHGSPAFLRTFIFLF